MISLRVPKALAFWQRRADKLLLTAVFDPDETRGLNAAVTWLGQNSEDRITYRHHRLLGAVSRRFGANPALLHSRAMLRRVERQLWVRAVASVTDVAVTLGHFDQMDMPYFLHGNILWLVEGRALFQDLEMIDITVPEEAFGYALSQLWSRGWTPGPKVLVLFAPDPVDLVRTGYARIRLRSDRYLLSPHAKVTPSKVWDEVVHRDIFGQSLRFPQRDLWPSISIQAGAGETEALQTRIDREEAERRH